MPEWKLYENCSEVDLSRKPILFILHGESEAYMGKAASHTRQVCLTEKGKQRALAIANQFPKDVPPDHIFYSSYLRAWQTADPTLRRFSSTHHDKLDVEEFTYLGSLAGRWSTMEGRQTLVESYWKRSDPAYQDGDGESFIHFIRRVRRVLNQLQRQRGSILIFTHEQFIRAAQGLLDGSISDTPTSDEMHRFRQRIFADRLPYGQIVELASLQDRTLAHA